MKFKDMINHVICGSSVGKGGRERNMKPKPLDGKLQEDNINIGKDPEEGEDFSFVENFFYAEDIKSACDFYLKYRNKPFTLADDFPEYQLVIKVKLDHGGLELYNTWLFKLAFRDVFKEV
jgi:hypothetical protein